MKTLLSGLLLLLCFVVGHLAYAQDAKISLPQIVPASPNAAEIGRYGAMDVGFQTGSANVQIPLFSLEGGNVPVALNYSTGGVRVDQVASRSGLGWLLSAGGAIVRNVNGKPDELSTRLYPNITVVDNALLNVLRELSRSSSYSDSEPDMFVFNFAGFSGKFILDGDKKPMLIPHNNLKIQCATDLSSIVITAPDGSIYRFADVENSVIETACYGEPLVSPGQRVPTAWYLSDITLPNNEKVTFQYSDCFFTTMTGIQEVVTRTLDAENGSVCTQKCAVVSSRQTCRTDVTSFAKLLTAATFRSSKITFEYIDRLDVPGDKLFSKIVLWQDDQVVKETELLYMYGMSDPPAAGTDLYAQNHLKYRPYLQYVVEKGNDRAEVRRHTFEYNDINALPHRLSTAQDHYGYYNGKTSNSGYVAKPEDPEDEKKLPLARADRNVYSDYAGKGALQKIIYPTGGSLEIGYEGNTFRTSKLLPPPTQLVSVSIAQPASVGQTKNSAVFTIPGRDERSVWGQDYLSGGVLVGVGDDGSAPVDEITGLMMMEIVEYSTNRTIYGNIFKLGDNLDMKTDMLQAGVSYFIRITVLHANANIRRYSANVKYISGHAQTIEVNEPTGGVRVQKIVKKDGLGHNEIRHISYAALATPNVSSGVGSVPIVRQTMTNAQLAQCGIELTQMDVLYCKSEVGYSNALNNLYLYGQNHVYYSDVVESIGDNYEGGGIAHKYEVQRDAPSRPKLWQSFAPAVKNSNTGHLNGMELEQLVFKMVDEQVVPCKKIVNTYKVDSAVDLSVPAYYVNKRYDFPKSSTPVDLVEFSGYEVQEYAFYSRWTYKSKTIETDYSSDGVATLETTKNYGFTNKQHTQVSYENTTASDGSALNAAYAYPHEMVANGEDADGTYQEMVNRNMVSPVIKKTSKRNDIITNIVFAEYSRPVAGLCLPRLVKEFSPVDNKWHTRVNYLKYDSKANVLSASENENVLNTYIYGYGQTLPIAKVLNAASDQVAYTSFESNSNGNWSFGYSLSTNAAVTGIYCYDLVGGLSKPNLSESTVYVVSYWSNSSSPYNITGSFQYKTGKSIGDWRYYEHRVKNVSSVSITGTGLIDEVRLYPEGALMSTYTYRLPFGVSSIGSDNGRIAYYEYEPFGRFSLEKNEDGNIVRKVCYSYYGYASNCMPLFKNTPRSETVTRKNCASGYIGTSVVYSVPAGKYTSDVSQDDADLKAINEITLMGQSYANTNATCLFVYKNEPQSKNFVKQCDVGYIGSSVLYSVAEGTYTSTISILDANQKALADIAANGQNNANQKGICTVVCNAETCNGVNQKCIKGVCETGKRINTDSYELGSRWVCVYHYQWSDGTISEDYMQLSTSRCALGAM
ncbi:DUF5977 domain-containing protein [Filimonas effusa]|uniref:DUF5977 domain-containing protein n=1 Tax=Filimonas effusa TaxID=2508721 RepID=A0A4Q1D7V5_9BACT|nr:DUF5977 domain-containing protein [Filimonas effusa]RXK85384.1 hypothetical protein ESB13_00735 [Filimonas effusa]